MDPVEELLIDETDTVSGTPPPTQTLDGWDIEVTGSRLLIAVDVLEDFVETTGGILRPTRKKWASDDPHAPPTMSPEDVELERGTVVGVGLGRYNADQGVFHGSQYTVGDVVLLRRGDRTSPFVDEIPGRKDVLIVQEDIVRARLHRKEA